MFIFNIIYKLELINCFAYFSTVVSSSICVYFSIGLSLLIQHFQHPQDPVENVVLTTRGLQERTHKCGWDDGGQIGKIINYF